MEIEQRVASDMEPVKSPREDAEYVLQRHRHPHRHRDKHRSSSEKHRQNEGKPSKHKHKHHKHKHRKRHRKEHEDAICDEIGSGDDRGDDGSGRITGQNRALDAAQASQAESTAFVNCGKLSPPDNFPLGSNFFEVSLSDNFHPDNTSMEGDQSLPRDSFLTDNAIAEIHREAHLNFFKADLMEIECHSVENTVDPMLRRGTISGYSHELQESQRCSDAAVQETGKPSEDEKEEGEILDSDFESGEIESGNKMNGEGRETIEKSKQSSSRQANTMLDNGEGDAGADQAFQSIQNIASTYDSDQGSKGVVTDRSQKCVNKPVMAYDDSLTSEHTATQVGENSTDDMDAKRQNKRKRSESLIDAEEKNLKSFSPKDELMQSLHGDDDSNMKQKFIPSHLRSGNDDSSESFHEHEIQAKTDSDGLSGRHLGDAQEKREQDRQSKSKEDANRRDRRSRSRELLSDSRHHKDKGNQNQCLQSREDGYSKLEHRRSRSRELGAYHYSKRSERTRRSRSRENNYDYGSAKDWCSKGISEMARRSESTEAGPDHKYAKDIQEGYECNRRSRSREAVGASKRAGTEWSAWSKLRETKNEIQLAKDNHPETERSRRSRSKEVDYHSWGARDNHRHSMSRDTTIHRKRSLSRDRKDNPDRRWSRRSTSRDRRDGAQRRRSVSRDHRDSPDRRRRRRSPSRSHRDTSERMRRRSYSRDHRGSFDRRRRRSVSRDRRSRSRDGWRERRNEWDKNRHSSSIDGQGNVGEAVSNFKNMSAGIRQEEDEDVGDLHVAAEEDELEKFKEESRKRRQAIIEKYRVLQQTKNEDTPEGVEGKMAAAVNSGQAIASEDPKSISVENEPVDADELRNEPMSFDLGKVPPHDVSSLISRLPGIGGLGEGTPKSEKSHDMFCDYIFGESPAGGRKLSKGDGLALETSCLTDNWDDAEGYYCYRIGEVLDARYEVAASHGRGVFSSVVRVRDLKATRGEPEEVAIKIIRNNDLMFKSGQQELVILKKLVGADSENQIWT